jgi:hypothetical protein
VPADEKFGAKKSNQLLGSQRIENVLFSYKNCLFKKVLQHWAETALI